MCRASLLKPSSCGKSRRRDGMRMKSDNFLRVIERLFHSQSGLCLSNIDSAGIEELSDIEDLRRHRIGPSTYAVGNSSLAYDRQ
jgi:hypothetical protein